jgi:hypothetical protein
MEVWRAVRAIAVGALLLVCAIQALTVFNARSQDIPLGLLSAQQVASHEEQVFGPFTLGAGHSLNELEAFSPLDDEWVELDYLLANVQTGETWDLSDEFSYYSGTDSDGAWSEGSRSHRALLTNLPAGDYTLTASATLEANRFALAPHGVELHMQHDIAPWRNFWMALAVVGIYPAFLLRRAKSFEDERWEGSHVNLAAAS